MAYQSLGHHSDHDKLLVLDPDSTHDDMNSMIKSEPPDLDGVHYDLDGSNSCFGAPFTMDDTWTKTPLMEELDSLATTASATSSLGDDDNDSRSGLTLTVAQWRLQGSKILKVPPSSQSATSPPLSLSTRSPSKRLIIDNRPGSPVFSEFAETTTEKRVIGTLADTHLDDRDLGQSSVDFSLDDNVISTTTVQPVIETGQYILKIPEEPQSTSSISSTITQLAEHSKNGLVSVSTSAPAPDCVNHEGMTFPCSICGQCYTDITSLTSHLVSHAICSSCGLVFKDDNTLRIHEQVHHSNQEIVEVKKASRKKEKPNKRSLNEKMPCLASALSRDSATIGERLVMKNLPLDLVSRPELVSINITDNNVSTTEPVVIKKSTPMKCKVECPECGIKLKDYKALGLHTLKLHPTSSTGLVEYSTRPDIKIETETDRDFELKFCVEPMATSPVKFEKLDESESTTCDSSWDRDDLNPDKQVIENVVSPKSNSIACQECGVEFLPTEQHLLEEHQCNLMRCSLCDRPFKNLDKIALHKIGDHPSCAECDAVFKNFDSLTLHEELQHFRCAVCGHKCTDHEGLSMHKRTEHTKCKWCKKWFPCKKNLLAHEDQGPFPCGECDAEFCSLSELVLHEKETHLMCSVCKVVCVSRKELTLHTHHQCKLCSLEYLSAGALLDHQHREHSKCGQCGLLFRDTDILARHTQLQHSSRIKCYVCAEYYANINVLLAHLKTHVPCRHCGTFFKTAENVARHELEEHSKPVVKADAVQLSSAEDSPLESDGIQCCVCTEEFETEEQLHAHERLEHEVCRQCNLSFPTKRHLATHRRTAHREKRHKSVYSEGEDSDAMEPENKYSSFVNDTDSNEFDVDVKIKTHRSAYAKDQFWMCSICNKAFPSKKNLNAHHRRVHIDKPYTPSSAFFKCSFCSQAFSCRAEFIEHNKECSKGKRVPCNICGKTFSTSGNLAQHKRIHTSEKPYKCDTCGKTFAQNGTLYRHKTVHTKETPYACQACGKQFGLKGNLVMHLKNIHKIVYKEVPAS